MEILRNENARLRKELAESEFNEPKIKDLQQQLDRQLAKRGKGKVLQMLIAERENVRAEIAVILDRIRITNLRMWDYLEVQDRMRTEIIVIMVLKQDIEASKHAKPFIADKDAHIADLLDDINIYDEVDRYFHMKTDVRQKYLDMLLGLLSENRGKLIRIDRAWRATCRDWTVVRARKEFLQNGIRNLRADLDNLHASFKKTCADRSKQLKEHKDALMEINAWFEKQLEPIKRAKKWLAEHPDQEFYNSESQIEDEKPAENSAKVFDPYDDGPSTSQRIRSRQQETTAKGPMVDNGTKLNEDLKNMLQLSARVLDRLKTSGQKELVRGGNSAPNLNKLGATVAELYHDVEHLIDGLKGEQIGKESKANMPEECAAPSQLQAPPAGTE